MLRSFRDYYSAILVHYLYMLIDKGILPVYENLFKGDDTKIVDKFKLTIYEPIYSTLIF